MVNYGEELPHEYRASLELPSARQAEIVWRATKGDAELRPEQVSRVTRVEGAILHLEFRGATRKALRTSVLSFYDFIDVSLRTLVEFDDGASEGGTGAS